MDHNRLSSVNIESDQLLLNASTIVRVRSRDDYLLSSPSSSHLLHHIRRQGSTKVAGARIRFGSGPRLVAGGSMGGRVEENAIWHSHTHNCA